MKGIIMGNVCWLIQMDTCLSQLLKCPTTIAYRDHIGDVLVHIVHPLQCLLLTASYLYPLCSSISVNDSQIKGWEITQVLRNGVSRFQNMHVMHDC